MLTFNKKYFGLAVLIFTIEVLIALFVRDTFVRPYLGDVLVVILIYCFARSFLNVPVLTMAVAVLAFAFTVEFLQYLNIVEKLGLQGSAIARTVIGTSFAWKDLLAYVAGFVLVLVVEKYALRRNTGVTY
ncbi:DUF2809 domain-containing protein [Fulvivirgaceae bacterium PWU4]|uniref:DUF2809 domain-containing protein n=1 Tax=Chryseosolibacter histidini TaxID=2782349 RepID=A0AAP2GM98_9BACT|nr:DUF2809 domain-containing protein [Chryseosolibacter histidini]MBT1695380.1 DUF2809 domain-containing protein [Chryseosolibacter histidini]